VTADEIRSQINVGSHTGLDEAQFLVLREIAAQLAELNERLTPGKLEVNIYDCSFEGSRKAGEKPAVPEMLDVLESLARVIRDVAKTNPAGQWIVNGGPFTEAEKLIRKAKGEAHV
jgi:hypothetical protein